MTAKDTSNEYHVRSILCLHNDINKILMLPNVITFNMLSNNDDDDENLGKMLPLTSTVDGTLIHNG